MNKFIALIVGVFGFVFCAFASPSDSELQEYRDLTLKVRKAATFKIPMPSGSDMTYDYQIEFGEPIYPMPLTNDFNLGPGDGTVFSRMFYDRIFLKDESFVNIGNDRLPLTCIFIQGQDNRFAGSLAPTFPKFIMKIYLVANDYTCTGPLNPGWPANGGKKENWETYLYFEVKDPTIMLPIEAHVRYRWNEFKSILVK